MAARKTTKPAKRSGGAAAKPKRGRGNPPEEHQYKKGQSGNPKGRPKGSKNLTTLITDAAYNQITVTTKTGEKRKLTKIEAAILQLANKAAQGDMSAMVKLINWVDETERRAAEARPTELSIGEADLQVLKTIYERIKLCEPQKAP